MYCKYCGKEISEDSIFCKFCGEVVAESSPLVELSSADGRENISECVDLKSIPLRNNQVDVILSTKEDAPVKVEISRKELINKSTFADEVIANFKMIGLSAILWFACLVVYSCYRYSDRSSDTPIYESCYDQEWFFYHADEYKKDWEYWYARELSNIEFCERHNINWNNYRTAGGAILAAGPDGIIDIHLVNSIYDDIKYLSVSELKEYGDSIATKLNLGLMKTAQIQNQAMEYAKSQKEEFYADVYANRQRSYKSESVDYMKWFAIILLSITIVGRYIIKFFKWVFNNASV